MSVGAQPIPSRRRRPQRPAAGHPDPLRLARAVAFTFLEIEAGRRPVAQLAPVLAPALQVRLSEIARRPGPGPAADAIVAVRATCPTPDVCDAAIVVRRGRRVGVLAIRLERYRHAWRVVELARPEDRGRSAAARSMHSRTRAAPVAGAEFSGGRQP
ncbi:MAG: hypothetical protein KY462_07190 [Actinobacteria bacterium]|nr:hypothetical protein [Actinomycetota bacterium]